MFTSTDERIQEHYKKCLAVFVLLQFNKVVCGYIVNLK